MCPGVPIVAGGYDPSLAVEAYTEPAVGVTFIVRGEGELTAIATHGATLAPLMRRAGFRYVFLGIENVVDADLRFLRARAKNALGADGRTVGHPTAIERLHRHGLYVVGGLILGNPDDPRESIEANLAFARRWVDYIHIRRRTPHADEPGTARAGTHRERRRAGVRRHHRRRPHRAPPEDIEFFRWRAERWMKVTSAPSSG